MTSETTTISCPNCGTEINVSDVLRHQLEEQLTSQLKEQFAGQQHQLETARRNLETKKKELAEREQSQQESVTSAIAEGRVPLRGVKPEARMP